MKTLNPFFAVILSVAFFIPTTSRCETYDLEKVSGIQAFSGSDAARKLLAKNGFVVADPSFKQIFEAYIKGAEGKSLPSFITADSAWDTYHVLLEEGVKIMEETQRRRLLDFSRHLLTAANDPKTANPDLVLFAAVGVALQDGQSRSNLTGEARNIVEALRTGSSELPVPIGFPLSPLQFRAQSFYTQSPELSDYFAARQWYASVVFRLTNPRETRSAIQLAQLIMTHPELETLWHQLSDLYDTFLATAEDGTIREYAEAAKSVAGVSSLNVRQLAEIRQHLESRLPLPRITDQLLSPAEYSQFPTLTRGLRLLPPRRLPCAVCFQETTDPKIPGRMYPSGLDFFAASRVLRSPAAIRAVQSQFGKSAADLILKTDCGPMPDSLHGEAMQLLATLQQPLPAQAPAPMHAAAWSDLQLWTQLGAWAQQRHTWALHTKLTFSVAGMISPPQGIVAPYPEFFSGLAKLTRRTAAAFDHAGFDDAFDAKTAAKELWELLDPARQASFFGNEKEMEKNSGRFEQLSQFRNRYYNQRRAELEKDRTGGAYKKVDADLQDLARRCAENGTATEADTEILKSFFGCRQNISQLLNNFAPVCDRLAALAKKSLASEVLTQDDAKWIENYGITVATFHFYYGNSYEVPQDDFPTVTRVFSNPLSDSMLYAGLARPQALYVLIPNGKSFQLYRGAVMTYREFVQPNDKLLDDESWREQLSKGQTPPAPSFTRTFRAEMTATEWIKKLRAQAANDDINYGDIRDTLWQIGTQATEKDLPQLIDLMTNHSSGDLEEMADIIAKLPWQSQQKEFIQLLASPDNRVAHAAAHILITQPDLFDANLLIVGFGEQSTRTRRLICAILSLLPRQTDASRKLFLSALHDPSDSVRWQSALAIETAKWNDTESQTALLKTLNDPNELVAMAAAHSLGKLGATNIASELFTKFELLPKSGGTPPEKMRQLSFEIMKDTHDGQYPADRILDVDDLATRLEFTVPERARQNASMRLPPRQFVIPLHDYGLSDALIEALGDLAYTPAEDELFKLLGTEYDAEATTALRKFAPDQLTKNLLATAKDKQVDSYLREKALVTLCNIRATNCVRNLIPLLDDTTPIVYTRRPPGDDWRVCDRAGATIAILLGWQHEIQTMTMYVRADEREAIMTRVREWANQPDSKRDH